MDRPIRTTGRAFLFINARVVMKKECPICFTISESVEKDWDSFRRSGRLIFRCDRCGTEFTRDGVYFAGHPEFYVCDGFEALEDGFQMQSNEFQCLYDGAWE